MVRGSAPTHTFTLPEDVGVIKRIIIVYAQDDVEILRKTEEDCEISGNTVSLKLDQEETLLFDFKKNMQIQMKAVTEEGTPLISNIMKRDVRKCLIDEVL